MAARRKRYVVMPRSGVTDAAMQSALMATFRAGSAARSTGSSMSEALRDAVRATPHAVAKGVEPRPGLIAGPAEGGILEAHERMDHLAREIGDSDFALHSQKFSDGAGGRQPDRCRQIGI